jgi:two-component system, OmpR family, KDP operon response regulator KdpE
VPGTTGESSPCHIVVIEDDAAIARLLDLALSSEEIVISLASLGSEGLQALDAGPVDLVVVDMRLPDMAGDQLVSRIKHDHDVAVLVLTANTSPAARRLAMEAGADDFCLKPFDPDEFLERVAFLLRRGAAVPGDASAIRARLLVDQHLEAVWRDGEQVSLSRTEWELLALLLANPGEPVSTGALFGCIPGGWNDPDLAQLLVDRLNAKLAGGEAPLIDKQGESYVLRAEA